MAPDSALLAASNFGVSSDPFPIINLKVTRTASSAVNANAGRA